jgi:hypothetical protein
MDSARRSHSPFAAARTARRAVQAAPSLRRTSSPTPCGSASPTPRVGPSTPRCKSARGGAPTPALFGFGARTPRSRRTKARVETSPFRLSQRDTAATPSLHDANASSSQLHAAAIAAKAADIKAAVALAAISSRNAAFTRSVVVVATAKPAGLAAPSAQLPSPARLPAPSAPTVPAASTSTLPSPACIKASSTSRRPATSPAVVGAAASRRRSLAEKASDAAQMKEIREIIAAAARSNELALLARLKGRVAAVGSRPSAELPRVLRTLGYAPLGPIAQGAFSTILRCRAVETGRIVAVKSFDALRCARDVDVGRARDGELCVLRLLREHPPHAHIANMLAELGGGSATHTHAVLEYADGGTLKRHLLRAEMGAPLVAAATRQLAEALAHLHALDTAHRDVKRTHTAPLTSPTLAQPWHRSYASLLC